MDGLWEKRGGAAYPCDERAWRFFHKLPNHTRFVADTKDPTRRSGKQHRFWFSLVNTLFENQDYYKDVDKMRDGLLIALGYCEWFKVAGRDVPFADSVSYGKMPQDKFDALVTATLDFMEERGFDRAELLAQTREMAGAA
jgi:hypothetical protein